ncbi:nucleoside 2-deoxyribosyltransferase [Candidatus Woesearchaeota archaeon]|nr:nucleoside 2-deoxyribosyltransferase [Candidatus Woesearchaeota archaeon]
MMNKSLKIYFAASIRGGRELQPVYEEIVTFLETKGKVLTEHLREKTLTNQGEQGITTQQIFERDMKFLQEANVMIAEVTVPSLGVGYELAVAEQLRIPILCLYYPIGGKSLSAMIQGNTKLVVKEYRTLDEAKKEIEEFLEGL